MDDYSNLLTRRTALKRAAALFGGTLTASQLGLLTRTVAAMSEDAAPRFLSDDHFLMLKQIAGLIIPETDTPGAIGARVHHFIDLMLTEWASPARQARYVAGLEDIDRRARESGADGFSRRQPMHQLRVLQALDNEAFADGSQNFFRELKRMVLFAYYTSEPGATVELRFQRIPGDYQPCLPMHEVDRAWFWNGFSYDL